MKTSNKTIGFGGFAAETKDACLVQQHQTGASLNGSNHMTHLILTHKGYVKKLGSYIVIGLVMSGSIPMFLAAWLIMAIEAFGVWVLGAVVVSIGVVLRQVIKRVY